MHGFTDAINASIEIARRGFDYQINKLKDKFYPELSVKHRWKEMATGMGSWKELCNKVKKSKVKYRVSLNEVDYKFKVFKQSSRKSLVTNYVFIT